MTMAENKTMTSEEFDKWLFGNGGTEMKNHVIAETFFAGLPDICCPPELLDAKHNVEHAQELHKKAAAKRNAEMWKNFWGR